MLKDERDKEILRQLLHDGEVSVEQLAERFETSPSTIRRELADLEEAGFLRRTHGGAIQAESMLYEPFRRIPSFSAQEQRQAAEKRRIGLAAAEMIKDGEIVALSAGTTTTQVGRSIHHRKVTIVTNAINIAMELSHRIDLKLVMTGGVLSKNCFALTGPSGIASVNEMFYDRAFISVDGIDPEHGLTSDNPELAAVNRAIIQQSRETVVVADHSKLGKISKNLVAPIAKVDLIITDIGAPRHLSGSPVKMLCV